MPITTVRGTAVDCHVCRITHQRFSEHDAHSFAATHANSHQAVPTPAFAGPRVAKTSINHGRHLFLDMVTLGLWIPIHVTAWLFGGRKTKFKY